MEYKLRLNGPSAMLRWEYNFDISSDLMAREYTLRALRNDPAARQAMSADLFNMTEDYVVSHIVIMGLVELTEQVD